MQAEVEINKHKENIKSGQTRELLQTSAEQKNLRNQMTGNSQLIQAREQDILKNMEKGLEKSPENE